MLGAVKVVRDGQSSLVDPRATSTSLPLNTLDDAGVPPMDETPLFSSPSLPLETPAATPTTMETAPVGAATGAVVAPVVWVSGEGAWGYQQPGLNMKKVRALTKWEELQIVESSNEGWDRVRDEAGSEFWVEKKVVTVIRPQNLSRPSIAEQKVMAFYTDVAEGRHSDAYAQLSPEWKRELSFNDFVKGYARTDSLRTEITNVYELGEDRYQVDVSMTAVEEGEPIRYMGIYTLEKVDSTWYMTSGRLVRDPQST